MKRNRGRIYRRILLLMAFFLSTGGVIVGAGVGGMALYRWVMAAPEFAVSEIAVYDHALVLPDEVIKISGLRTGENIFRTDIRETLRRIRRDPRIKDAFIRRVLPDRIQVYIVERNPIAIVQLDRLYGIDAGGTLILLPATERLPNLPVITVSHPKSPAHIATQGRETGVKGDGGATAIAESPEIRRAIYVIEQLQSHAPELLKKVSEVHVKDPYDPILYTVHDGVAIRLGIGRYPTKLRRLHMMFERLRRDGISTSSIDLRFEDQVIVRPIVTGTPQDM